MPVNPIEVKVKFPGLKEAAADWDRLGRSMQAASAEVSRFKRSQALMNVRPPEYVMSSFRAQPASGASGSGYAAGWSPGPYRPQPLPVGARPSQRPPATDLPYSVEQARGKILSMGMNSPIGPIAGAVGISVGLFRELNDAMQGAIKSANNFSNLQFSTGATQAETAKLSVFARFLGVDPKEMAAGANQFSRQLQSDPWAQSMFGMRDYPGPLGKLDKGEQFIQGIEKLRAAPSENTAIRMAREGGPMMENALQFRHVSDAQMKMLLDASRVESQTYADSGRFGASGAVGNAIGGTILDSAKHRAVKAAIGQPGPANDVPNQVLAATGIPGLVIAGWRFLQRAAQNAGAGRDPWSGGPITPGTTGGPIPPGTTGSRNPDGTYNYSAGGPIPQSMAAGGITEHPGSAATWMARHRLEQPLPAPAPGVVPGSSKSFGQQLHALEDAVSTLTLTMKDTNRHLVGGGQAARDAMPAHYRFRIAEEATRKKLLVFGAI